MDDAEADVLAYMDYPVQHPAKLHGTNPLERLSGEIKRRSEVVGSSPTRPPSTRPIDALLLEQNDEWAKLGKIPPAQQVECQRRGSAARAT